MKTQELMKKWLNVYEAKNADYGDSWKKTGEIFAILMDGREVSLKTPQQQNAYALMVRIIDKLSRFSNLYFSGDQMQVKTESLVDTMADCGTYCFMEASLVSEPGELPKDVKNLITEKLTKEIETSQASLLGPTEMTFASAAKPTDFYKFIIDVQERLPDQKEKDTILNQLTQERDKVRQVNLAASEARKKNIQVFQTMTEADLPKILAKAPPEGVIHIYGVGVVHHRDGRLHRETGPAVVRLDGTEDFFLYGNQFQELDFWHDRLVYGKMPATDVPLHARLQLFDAEITQKPFYGQYLFGGKNLNQAEFEKALDEFLCL